MEKPCVTAIITAYGRTRYVYEALQSALSQTLKRKLYEIIVVTNFDMDHEFVVKNNIRTVRCEKKELGTKIALALEIAQGDIIAILEDDDLWETNKLETIVNIFQRRPRIGFIHNWMSIMGAEGQNIQTSFQSRTVRKMNSIDEYLIDTTKLTYGKARLGISYAMDYYSSSISFRKAAVMNYIEALREISTSTDVFYFFACLLSEQHLLAISEKLTKYRIHSSNLSLGAGDQKDFFSRRKKYSIEVLADYKKLLALADYSGKKVTIKLIKWRLSCTVLETIWFNEDFSRLQLLREMLSHIRYISSKQLGYDLKIIAYSFLLLIRSEFARNLFLRTYYERH